MTYPEIAVSSRYAEQWDPPPVVEKSDKQGIINHSIVLRLHPVRIHQVGYLLECKKTDSQRHQYVPDLIIRMKPRIGVFQKKIEILIVENDPHIDGNSDCQKDFAL